MDSLEFDSLVSDPLSVHSKTLFSRYPNDSGDGFEYEGSPMSQSLSSNNQRISVDEIDSAKFALFCKWLNESNFETKSLEVKSGVASESIDKDSSEDEFVDTDNEIVPVKSDKQFKDTLPTVIEQANISSVVHETEIVQQSDQCKNFESDRKLETESEKPDSAQDEHVYETLVKMPSQTNLLELPNPSLLSLNLSCASSASDLTSENGNPRRPCSHNKGRAPPIPSAAVQSIGDKSTDVTSQDKEKKKKNLLTYIPSIFKPITPSNSSKNLSKETDI